MGEIIVGKWKNIEESIKYWEKGEERILTRERTLREGNDRILRKREKKRLRED